MCQCLWEEMTVKVQGRVNLRTSWTEHLFMEIPAIACTVQYTRYVMYMCMYTVFFFAVYALDKVVLFFCIFVNCCSSLSLPPFFLLLTNTTHTHTHTQTPDLVKEELEGIYYALVTSPSVFCFYSFYTPTMGILLQQW